ncbi:MAG: histidine kinase [Flavobacteriales bacterium]
MRSRVLLTLLYWTALVPAMAQFPLTRTLEIRHGQQRPVVRCLAQDEHGLIWAGTDKGLFWTDGERTERASGSGTAQVTAIVRLNTSIIAAWSSGLILRCNTLGCDTLFMDPLLSEHRVNALCPAEDGALWLGTHGAGLWRVSGNEVDRLDMATGMPDDHVNDLVTWGGGVVAATDQGLVLCNASGVHSRCDEASGAPDNLVLSVATGNDGLVWAGTDRGGVFSWKPGPSAPSVLPIPVNHGPVVQLAVREGLVWMGTRDHGLCMVDLGVRQGHYVFRGSSEAALLPVNDLMLDADGVAWWCAGQEFLYRSDPTVLFIPEHENTDLRGIKAICSDDSGNVWFATDRGLFRHANTLADTQVLRQVGLGSGQRTPVVSLAADANGTIWAATFGDGVYAIDRNERIRHFTGQDGLVNDNVLAVRSAGDSLWFGTLGGVVGYWAGRFHPQPGPGSEFIYDVLPDRKGGVWAVSDGNGILHGDATGVMRGTGNGPRTYFSLVHDAQGRTWAGGPGTGLCRLEGDSVRCAGSDLAPFAGDLFALGLSGTRLLAFGGRGTMAYDPASDVWVDVTRRFGLEGAEAELNTVCTGVDGDLWFACNKGLYRIQPQERHFARTAPAVITGIRLANETYAGDERITTPHDRNDLAVQFTGIHYADPSELRFAYQLVGLDEHPLVTRDREVTYSSLPPGDYRFRVIAFVGDEVPDQGWVHADLVVLKPWWRTNWAILAWIVLVVGTVFAVVRSRERRARIRSLHEQEKVRFQLEALRNQVDPHFLFNSFNTLVDLIESEPSKAVLHVEQLSDLFRSLLQLRDKELISVADDLRLMRTYFELEEQRFGSAIALQVEVDEAAMHRHIVPMTLQMLVENALKHNVVSREHPLVVTIRSEGDLLLVSNTIRPRTTSPRSTGFGLHSIQRRYQALTERPIVIDRENGRFTVAIPLVGPSA